MDESSIIALVPVWVSKYLGYFLGGYDGPLCALLVLTVVNYTTGVICVISEHKNFDKIGIRTILSKVLIFMIVGVCNILDSYILGYGNLLRTAILLFYISEEGLSILENATHLGLPVPDGIKRVLKQLKKRDT